MTFSREDLHLLFSMPRYVSTWGYGHFSHLSGSQPTAGDWHLAPPCYQPKGLTTFLMLHLYSRTFALRAILSFLCACNVTLWFQLTGSLGDFIYFLQSQLCTKSHVLIRRDMTLGTRFVIASRLLLPEVVVPRILYQENIQKNKQN